MYKVIPQTSYRMELSGRIIDTAIHKFISNGVKSVKMDDIANILGISKRTLYEIFANKEKLLLECLRVREKEYDCHMANYSKGETHNVIDIIIEFYKYQIESVTEISPDFFRDIGRYHKVMAYFEERRKEHNRNAKDFFLRGVEEGYFRNDVDFDIVLRIGQVSMDYAMHTEMYKEFSMKHILHNVLLLFLRGICTAEGVTKLDVLMSEIDKGAGII